MTSRIIGTGSALPKQIIANEALSDKIGLTPDEIERKTGILTRHWASSGETTSTFATEAAKKALHAADIAPNAIDLIVVSTSSPDMLFPSVACLVQKRIGCRPIPAFDINASCSGFLYALSIGDQYIKAGLAKKALILSSEIKSVYLNPHSPQTGALFGDGAGAVVLSDNKGRKGGIRSIKIASGGPSQQLVYLPAGGSKTPLSEEAFQQGLQFMVMDGTKLFRLAVKKMEATLLELLKENGASIEQIDLFLFHQANLRILEAVLKRLKIPALKHHSTIGKFGNSSSSSLPIALDDAIQSGKIKPRDKVALCTFGGGFTWAAALIDW
jgi:3-oxoacyl-[acyl-carrier-protein] synthase-3